MVLFRAVENPIFFGIFNQSQYSLMLAFKKNNLVTCRYLSPSPSLTAPLYLLFIPVCVLIHDTLLMIPLIPYKKHYLLHITLYITKQQAKCKKL